MNSRRALLAAELLVAALSGLLLFRSADTGLDYKLALQFLVVVFALDLLDLSMPYGETMPVDSAIVVACVILAGPLTAGVVTLTARVAVQLARRGTSQVDRVVVLLSRRLLALAVCVYLLQLMRSGPIWMRGLYAQGLIVGIVFVLLEILIAQVQAAPRLQERVWSLVVGNLALQGPLLAAQASVSVLAVITFGEMGIWGLVVMALLVALMRESLALYLAIRQAYRATIEALVTAIEAQDIRRKGHAERVEALSRSMALRMGIRGRALEQLGYAALLHDVDMLDSEYETSNVPVLKHAGDTVSTVRFLADVIPILRVCDGVPGVSEPSREVQQAAAVVAVASDIDDRLNPVESEGVAGAVGRLANLVDPDVLLRAHQTARFLGYAEA